MKIIMKPLDKLTPYAGNPKDHPQGQVQKIAASIREFGFLVPIVIDNHGVIIAGHGRYEAARLLNLPQVPTTDAGKLTPEQIRAFRIADNKVAESPWNDEALEAELRALHNAGYDITLAGFTLEDITGDGTDDLEKAIMAEEEHTPQSEPNDIGKQINERLQEIVAADPHRFQKSKAIILPLRRGSRSCLILADPNTGDAIKELQRYAAAGETSPLECLFKSIFTMKKSEADR